MLDLGVLSGITLGPAIVLVLAVAPGLFLILVPVAVELLQ